MPSPVKVYPVKGYFLHDVPARVQVIATKGEAEDLIASGAFTDNPNHPERDMSAPDDTKPGLEPEPEPPGELPTLSGTPAGPEPEG